MDGHIYGIFQWFVRDKLFEYLPFDARGFSHAPCDRPFVPRATEKLTGAACIQLSLSLFLVQ